MSNDRFIFSRFSLSNVILFGLCWKKFYSKESFLINMKRKRHESTPISNKILCLQNGSNVEVQLDDGKWFVEIKKILL